MVQYKARNKKKTNALKESELTTKPGPLIKKVLTENSRSDEFEEARTEWEFVGPIPSDSVEFVENCELCNHRNHLGNWMISNPYTNRTLKLGSDCIRRFILFSGTSSQADSNRFFDIQEKEYENMMEVNGYFRTMLQDPLPLAREFNRFRKTLISLLEARGMYPANQVEDEIQYIQKVVITIFPNQRILEKELFKLKDVILYPERIVTQKETKKYRDFKKYKEGETWKRSSRVTHTTLGNSSIYRPDRYIK